VKKIQPYTNDIEGFMLFEICDNFLPVVITSHRLLTPPTNCKKISYRLIYLTFIDWWEFFWVKFISQGEVFFAVGVRWEQSVGCDYHQCFWAERISLIVLIRDLWYKCVTIFIATKFWLLDVWVTWFKPGHMIQTRSHDSNQVTWFKSGHMIQPRLQMKHMSEI